MASTAMIRYDRANTAEAYRLRLMAEGQRMALSQAVQEARQRLHTALSVVHESLSVRKIEVATGLLNILFELARAKRMEDNAGSFVFGFAGAMSLAMQYRTVQAAGREEGRQLIESLNEFFDLNQQEQDLRENAEVVQPAETAAKDIKDDYKAAMFALHPDRKQAVEGGSSVRDTLIRDAGDAVKVKGAQPVVRGIRAMVSPKDSDLESIEADCRALDDYLRWLNSLGEKKSRVEAEAQRTKLQCSGEHNAIRDAVNELKIGAALRDQLGIFILNFLRDRPSNK